MKSRKLLAALTTISLFSVGLIANSMSLLSNSQAATEQTNRRLYVYLEGAWDNAGHMYIHYWGGATGTTWESCPEMTNVVSDYWQGLFFYDVPVDVTDFLVKDSSGNVSKSSNQSANMSVADLLVEGDYKVATVKSWVSDGASRLTGVADNAPMSSLQAVAVLNNINSCSSSYASGYNSWPQLDDLFISPSTLEGSTVVPDNFGDSTTIAEKNAYLEAKYLADQAA